MSSEAGEPVSLERFAGRVAGPREFVIAGSINGLIALWLYGVSGEVPLHGGLCLMTMLIPTAFLLPAFSSFFGVLAGALGRKAGNLFPTLAPEVHWLPYAIRRGLLCGICSGAAMWAASAWLGAQQINPSLSGWMTVASITVGSGIVAAGFHVAAIFATLRWP